MADESKHRPSIMANDSLTTAHYQRAMVVAEETRSLTTAAIAQRLDAMYSSQASAPTNQPANGPVATTPTSKEGS